MKKKMVSMFLVGAMMFSLCACGGEAAKESLESAGGNAEVQEEVQTEGESSSAEAEQTSQDAIERNDYYLWITTLEKGEQKVPTMLFDERLTLPLTEETMNELGTYSTHNFFALGDAGEYSNKSDFENVSEVLDSPLRMTLAGPMPWVNILIHEDNEENAFEDIYVVNPNEDDKMTVREAFNQGYWYVQSDRKPCNILGFEDKSGWNEETKQWDRFNCIIDTLGAPSYIMTSGDYQNIEDYDTVIDEEFAKEREYDLVLVSEVYTMIYEYEEYVLAIDMIEMFMADVAHTKIDSEVGYITYYPKEGWNKFFKAELTEECPNVIELK